MFTTLLQLLYAVTNWTGKLLKVFTQDQLLKISKTTPKLQQLHLQQMKSDITGALHARHSASQTNDIMFCQHTQFKPACVYPQCINTTCSMRSRAWWGRWLCRVVTPRPSRTASPFCSQPPHTIKHLVNYPHYSLITTVSRENNSRECKQPMDLKQVKV